MSNFPSNLIGDVVSFNYRRRLKDTRETWHELCVRTIDGIAKIGKFTDEEKALVFKMQEQLKTLTSGRWLWVGGTEWVDKPENFAGAYNCQSSNIIDWASFGYAMNFAMMGTGTGAVLEDKYISQLPVIRNQLNVKVIGEVGAVPKGERIEDTLFGYNEMCDQIVITVGDSRKGWVSAYQSMLELSSADVVSKHLDVTVDISNVRPNGEKLEGFGGTANPVKLAGLFPKLANITNKAIGRKLTSVECCLLLDEAALVVVAGNIRRCLPEDALVHTSNGLVPIKDVQVGDLVQTPLGFRKVLNKFDQGVQEVFKMRTKTSCPNPSATKNHRMAVVTSSKKNSWRKEGSLIADIDQVSWKKVEDLAPEDHLVNRYVNESGNDVDVLTSFCELEEKGYTQTYDIEVEDAHCFYCDGFLTHNSAGMKQFSSEDKPAEHAKENLWQCIDGQWRVDPERDALRMSNHTRVFHHKPSLADVVASVRKQYHSGEGAIQWAGEAIARSNADLLDTEKKKAQFICFYGRDPENAKTYLSFLAPQSNEKELNHRMSRYGLNPCFAEGTMVLTRDGSFPIESLVGKTVDIFDGHEWRTIDNFRITAENQPVYKITLHSGMEVTATEYHKFILEDGSRVELKDLQVGDRLLNSLEQQKTGLSVDGAYLKGFLTGDGTHCNNQTILKVYPPKLVCVDRLISSQKQIPSKVLVSSNIAVVDSPDYGLTPSSSLKRLNKLKESLSPWVCQNRWEFPVEVYGWDLNSKLEYIAGVMDADGCAMDTANGFGYQISSIHEAWLKGFQVLLASIGVKSKLNPKRDGRSKDFGDRGGVYQVKDCYRLTIAQLASIKLSTIAKFSRLKSFADRATAYVLKDNSYTVKSVEFSHVADKVYCCTVEGSHSFTLANGLVVGQCGEILGADFFCNLSEVHLNQLDPHNHTEQDEAFRAATLSVCALLHHDLSALGDRFAYSREIDPIIGVSFTGLFDFFVNLFGRDWLDWWAAGRPSDWGNIEEKLGEIEALNNYGSFEYLSDYFAYMEADYLKNWREVVETTAKEYCDRHGLRLPNRCTTTQPAGTKSLLTGASAGWHPPHSQRFIRRVTKRVNDPIALAAIALGYNVVPSQSDKDENGNLLTDPYDPRCTEWLIEIPVSLPWANLADGIDFNFSALAQFDFYMQVQQHYTRHNTSATISLRESEIEPLANAIYESIQNNTGYISAALLARFDENQTFPRLPFEAIDKATYERLSAEVKRRATMTDFDDALALFDNKADYAPETSACEGLKCEIGGAIDEAKQIAKLEVEAI